MDNNITEAASPETFEIVTLKSGTKSLRSTRHGETFHPGIGPVEEARLLHVAQHRLLERASQQGRFVLWDVGFGAAANAIAGIEELVSSEAPVEIHSFDRSVEPIRFALGHVEDLPYLVKYRDTVEGLLERGSARITSTLTWHLHLGDFRQKLSDTRLPSPHGIFYDPYSPRGNQDMWTLDHFTHLFSRLDPEVPCLVTNYTRSTAVRATLLLAGFHVGIGTLIGEKAETTVAANRPELVEKPLAKDWLKRVQISRNSAPMRRENYSISPISSADFEMLARHPQFS